MYILAGPNGAVKTTFANSFLPTFANCREFLNADHLAPFCRDGDRPSRQSKAELALEDACRKVIERTRVSNTKIVICREGNVVK
jgi:predicted ABC-type ATPase